MLVLIAATTAMKAAGWKGSGNTGTVSNVALLLAFLAFATMGALVAARVPRNPIGWLFLAIALLAVLSSVAENYAFHAAVEQPGSLPLAVFVAWLYSWTWYPTVILLLFVPLLYPTGRVPGPRWRFLLTAEIALAAIVTVLYMFNPGHLDGDKELPVNPIGIAPLGTVVDKLGPVLALTAISFIVLGIVSLVIRFRRSRDIERQQIKIMAYAATLVLAGLLSTFSLSSEAGDVVFAVTILLFPGAVGVAMLRYRLYDVDRVICKTIVYGALTVILGAAYAGSCSRVRRSSRRSPAARTSRSRSRRSSSPRSSCRCARESRGSSTGASTGAATTPRARSSGSAPASARRSTSSVLDGDLLDVVRETMQPAHASVWLRGQT